MRNRRLIILAALEMEARAAARGLGIPFQRNRVLKHATAAIEIHTIGMRAELLPQVLPVLTPSAGDRVWMVGLAGALDPALRVGDLVIDAAQSEPAFPAVDATLRYGVIHTSERLVASPAEKRALFSQTGALAVDMELRIVREALAPSGVPVVGIRTISDTAETRLDPILPNLVDTIGRPRWPTLAGAMLRRPTLLWPLVRLGQDSTRAAAELSRAIRSLAKH